MPGAGHGCPSGVTRFFAVICWMSAFARPAPAADMSFDVPAGCGTEAGFRHDLEVLVGAPASEVEPSVLVITEQPGGGFQLRLELLGEVRELVDADCRTLLRSAVVIAAAAARGQESQPAPPPPAASEPPAPPVPAATVTEPIPTPPPAPERTEREVRVAPVPSPQPLDAATSAPDSRPATFAIAAGIGLTVGTVPGASAVLDLRAGVDPTPIGFAVSARYWPGSEGESEGRAVHVTGLGGRAAALIELGSVLHASLGLEVDRLAGTGQEGVSGRGSDSVWLAAGALDLNVIPWSVEGLRLELGAGAQLAFVRPRFVVSGFGPVYEVPHVGGGAIIRAVWLFR